MKPAEFEEKEYEGPLYHQLARSNRFWPPGQVLENYLGFDAALFVDDPFFWRLHHFRRAPRGFILNSFGWPSFPRKRLRRSRLPRFRVNCFVQAKRPVVGPRVPKRVSGLGSRRPFFRISIESDQQRTLEAAAVRLHGRALFTYAAPVFSRSQELFQHMLAGSMVENSTFPDVAQLAGQHAWYYNEPGAAGVANRSFEPLRMPPLEARVEELARVHQDSSEEGQSPSIALAELLRELQTVVGQVSEAGVEARAAYLFEEWREIAALQQFIDAPPALFAFLGVEAFAGYFNLQWLTVL